MDLKKSGNEIRNQAEKPECQHGATHKYDTGGTDRIGIVGGERVINRVCTNRDAVCSTATE